ncbi:MAG: serine/threonine-protein kinase [Cyclobacteriaceae bacterium]
MDEKLSKKDWESFLSILDVGNEQIQKLIDQQEIAEDYFSNLQSAISDQLSLSLDFHLPEGYEVGKYKLLEELGKGGMAKVYRAQRADDLFEQEVAIKFLSPVLNTNKYSEYFNAERKLLATLNHPNIAKIFDGGTTDDGLLYMVMECVKGHPITEYVANKKLSQDRIIRLIIQVGHAIQHAHGKLVLHQDIKPSNVLIDETGNVKLLDLGIGKFLHDAENAESSFGGTLRYASPEQIKGEALSTRSDIFQLGVLAYELLGGAHPFRGEKEKVREQILNDAYPRLTRFPKDLALVIEKSMATDPSDRYESVVSLISDLENFLRKYPVYARPDSWQYRTSLFIKRNRVTTSLVLAILLITSTAAVLTRIQIIETEQERAKVQEANEFLTRIFDSNDPDLAQGEDITAAMLLENSKEELDEISDPEVKAYTQNLLGELYKKLGLWKEAGPLFFDALKNYQSNSPQRHELDIANLYNNISGYYRDISKYQEADSVLRLAIPMLAPYEKMYPLALARSYQDLAYVLFLNAEYEEAHQTIRKAIHIYENTKKEKGKYTYSREVELVFAYNTLASIFREQSMLDSALIYNVKSISIGKKYAAENISVRNIPLNNQSLIYNRMGNYDKQVEILTELYNHNKAIYDESNPKLIMSIANLGTAYHKKGDILIGDSLNQIAYRAYLKKFGPDHNYTVSTLYNLANSKYQQKKYQEAKSYFKEVLQADINNFGEDHPYVAGDYISLGLIEQNQGNYPNAEKLYLKGYDIYHEKFGANHQKISQTHSFLGALYGEMGKMNKAKDHYQKAIAISEEVVGSDHHLHKKYVKDWAELQKSL